MSVCLQAIDELEANLNAARGQLIDDEMHHGPPSILFQPQPVGEIDEGQPIYFEVQVQPAADATLTVEW
ncbi:unnamed protein product [Protopolystoma xenopodis]|uniref:Uncharacterized protein n=1 Tax=Protopolystoma xenopodis TaxID=117903 RepID=A0A3S5B243_9PLAT|nr:unnamed protein product [Protopolystoma xenopodis]